MRGATSMTGRARRLRCRRPRAPSACLALTGCGAGSPLTTRSPGRQGVCLSPKGDVLVLHGLACVKCLFAPSVASPQCVEVDGDPTGATAATGARSERGADVNLAESHRRPRRLSTRGPARPRRTRSTKGGDARPRAHDTLTLERD